MKKATNCATLFAAAALFLSLSSCDKEMDDISRSGGTVAASSDQKGIPFSFYALAGGVQLDAFSTQNPENPTSSVAITGLQTGETILSIDFRPATGQLYGLGSTSRLYVLNPQTGAARMIGTAPFTPTLSGTVAGFDFNPTVDRIRVVTSTG